MMMQEGPMEATSGFFIRRSGPLPALNRLSSFGNRENLDPITGRPVTVQRRSPLPEWYPRVPLQDITALLQAIERRNQRRVQETPAPISLRPVPVRTPEPEPMVHRTAPPSGDLTPEQKEQERKLTESIERIEKLVRKNLKRDLNGKKKEKEVKNNARVKTLMSMR